MIPNLANGPNSPLMCINRGSFLRGSASSDAGGRAAISSFVDAPLSAAPLNLLTSIIYSR